MIVVVKTLTQTCLHLSPRIHHYLQVFQFIRVRREQFNPLTLSLLFPSFPPSNSGPVLEKVVEYFHYSYANRDKDDVVDMDIPVDLCLEIIVAADYFQLDSKLPMQDFKH